MTAIKQEPSRADVEAVCREMGLKISALYKLVAELKRKRYGAEWNHHDPNRVAAQGRGIPAESLVEILRWRRVVVRRYMDAVSRAGFDLRRWSINQLHYWYIAP